MKPSTGSVQRSVFESVFLQGRLLLDIHSCDYTHSYLRTFAADTLKNHLNARLKGLAQTPKLVWIFCLAQGRQQLIREPTSMCTCSLWVCIHSYFLHTQNYFKQTLDTDPELNLKHSAAVCCTWGEKRETKCLSLQWEKNVFMCVSWPSGHTVGIQSVQNHLTLNYLRNQWMSHQCFRPPEQMRKVKLHHQFCFSVTHHHFQNYKLRLQVFQDQCECLQHCFTVQDSKE